MTAQRIEVRIDELVLARGARPDHSAVARAVEVELTRALGPATAASVGDAVARQLLDQVGGPRRPTTR